MDARRVIEGAMLGAAAGLAASWMMSEFHGAWKAASDEVQEEDEPNTVKAADAVAEATVGEPVSDRYREPTATVVHYGFGAFLGAIYGAAVELRPATSAGLGTAYGAAVSLVADEMAMPALGFTPPASDVAASTHLRGFVSHLVFGVSLEAVRRLLVASFREQTGYKPRSHPALRRRVEGFRQTSSTAAQMLAATWQPRPWPLPGWLVRPL